DLIGVSNELVINADKKCAKINELEREVEELKAKLEEKDNQIEESEERVDIEIETNLEALDLSKK
ncbi:3929_t:CDS:1, partial [Entrophospora sp. SA101]